jgi:hypothetical protein
MFAMTVLVAALLMATSFSPLTHAADPVASWKGDSILFDNRQYFPATEAKENESHGLPVGTIYYVSTEESNSGTGSNNPAPSANSSSNKAFVIYFSPGADPPQQTSAQFTSYDVSQSNVYSNRQGTSTITVTPKGNEDSYTSCQVEGIGWIVCPLTIFLAEGMDTIFNIISGFVAVQPLTVNDTNSPLHVAWNVMRSFANIAFIVLFLIIIYSQLTSWGLSNYGLKRLLPRLVVSAILVNISFLITALAVDISNIIGFGLQEILVNIRQSTFAITDQTWNAETTTWANAVSTVLSGGAVIGGGIALAGATAGSLSAALYMIVPLLIGLLLTAIFVMLILAARQAIIIILIVISPLAFVANLLPNTEKWFDKWRDLFLNMLLFFPAFSLVFGGAQLAGSIIIQNATGPFGFVMMLFGMAVQIAPLIITPLILKLSGGILGRIAQIANNPRKGMLDKTKNWASDRAGMARGRRLSNPNAVNPLTNIAQKMDRNRRYVKRATDSYEKSTEANAFEADQSRYQPLYNMDQSSQMRKDAVDNQLKLGAQNQVNLSGSRMQLQNVNLELSKTALSRAVKDTEATIEEYRARHVPVGASTQLATAINAMADTQRDIAVQDFRAKAAQGVREENLANSFMRSTSLRAAAGGIDEQGADTALASAVNTVREAYGKSINEARAINKHFNLTSAQQQAHAMGEDFTVTKDGVTRRFTANDIFTREAAIEDQVTKGTVEEVENIIMASGKGEKLYGFRTSIKAAAEKSGIGAKATHLGGQTFDDIGAGRITGEPYLNKIATRTLAKGKMSEKVISSLDPTALKRLLSIADGTKVDTSLLGQKDRDQLQGRVDRFIKLAQDTLNGDEQVNLTDASFDEVLKIARIHDPTFEPKPMDKLRED